MRVPRIAARRIVEEKAAEDAAYRRKLERTGRPSRAHARALSDAELVAKLRSMGIELDRAGLDELSRTHAAAHELADALLGRRRRRRDRWDEEWAWFAFECLWERWLPERPSLEMLDERMQAGYGAEMAARGLEACAQWELAWPAFLDLAQRLGIETIEAFDERFGGTQCVFNWVQDYDLALWNAGRDDPQYLRARIALAETVTERFGEAAGLTETFRRSLAESHFELGERETGDGLFRQWLDEDPGWGWGWIGWSDCHFLFARGDRKDPDRAISLLREGLSVRKVRDREDVLERLSEILDEAGRADEASDVRAEVERSAAENARTPKRTTSVEVIGSTLRTKERFEFGEPGLPLERLAELRKEGSPSRAGGSERPRKSPGRNEPCPCGSGKKFKKCCGP